MVHDGVHARDEVPRPAGVFPDVQQTHVALRATPDEEATVDEFLVRDNLAIGADVGERPRVAVEARQRADGSTERAP